jgi:hypothetical protein
MKSLARPLLMSLIALLPLVLTAPPALAGAAERPPTVVIVSIDDK